MLKHNNKSKGFPSYTKPPVSEVACGIIFELIEQLKVPHLGLFWEEVQEEYPGCQHAPPLGLHPQAFDIKGGGFPLPRVWFINKDENGLIQVQNDRFYYNWRKMHEEEPYPRYRNVIDGFKTNFALFEKFIKEKDLGTVSPIKCELTYVNHILKGQGWKRPADIHKVLRDVKWSSAGSRFLPEPRHVGWQTSFALPEDKGQLKVKLLPGFRKIDNHPLLLLEISANGLGADKSLDAIWAWFEVAHKWIVCGFADLTTMEIQKKVWERQDDITEA